MEVSSVLIRDEAKKQNRRREIATIYLEELARQLQNSQDRQPLGDLRRKLPAGHRQNSTVWESSGNLGSLKLPV